MNLKNYISSVTKEYTYILKCVGELDDGAMDTIERLLLPYAPIDISRPKRLMYQTNPVDFPMVKGAELHVVHITLSLPMSPYQYLECLFKHFPRGTLVCRSTDDPNEIELDNLNAKAEVLGDGSELPDALVNDPNYEEYTEQPVEYGAEHNKKLLNYLKGIEEENEKARKVDAPNAPFKWLDMPKIEGTDDFNADIKDAPTLGDSSGEQEITPLDTVPVARVPYKRKFAGKPKSSGGN